nr:MAG TPA: hypothetical protein [Caudoviricetes sp.]
MSTERKRIRTGQKIVCPGVIPRARIQRKDVISILDFTMIRR